MNTLSTLFAGIKGFTQNIVGIPELTVEQVHKLNRKEAKDIVRALSENKTLTPEQKKPAYIQLAKLTAADMSPFQKLIAWGDSFDRGNYYLYCALVEEEETPPEALITLAKIHPYVGSSESINSKLLSRKDLPKEVPIIFAKNLENYDNRYYSRIKSLIEMDNLPEEAQIIIAKEKREKSSSGSMSYSWGRVVYSQTPREKEILTALVAREDLSEKTQMIFAKGDANAALIISQRPFPLSDDVIERLEGHYSSSVRSNATKRRNGKIPTLNPMQEETFDLIHF